MNPIHPSIRKYTSTPSVALEYDFYFRDTPLFVLDTQILDKYVTHPQPLIDLGCGTGRHLIHFAKKGIPSFGVDLSTHMIRRTTEKLRTEKLSVRVALANLLELPLKDKSFFYALCMFSTIGLIGGAQNRHAFLKEVYRILQPGGLFFIHVHNRLFNIFEGDGRRWLFRTYFIGPFKGFEIGDKIIDYYRGVRDMYLHTFTLGEIKMTLKKAGFRIEKVYYLNEPRDAELPGFFLRSWRSNGFIIVARKDTA